MRNLSLFFLFISLSIISFSQTITYGFEDWSTREILEEPRPYLSSNNIIFQFFREKNVLKVDGPDGSDAIRMEGYLATGRDSLGQDTVLTFPANFSLGKFSSNDTTPFTEAYPINEVPKNFSFDCRFDLKTGDTIRLGFITFQGGDVIGGGGSAQFVVGQQQNWQKKRFPFLYEENTAPSSIDSVIFFCVMTVQNRDTSKTSFFEIDNLVLFGNDDVALTEQLPNNDFNSWEIISFRDPKGFISENFVAKFFGDYELVQEVNDATEGESAMKVVTTFINGPESFAEVPIDLQGDTGQFPYFCTMLSGEVDSALNITLGQDLGITADFVSFDYKYFPTNPLDSALFNINLILDNTVVYGKPIKLPSVDEYTTIEFETEIPEDISYNRILISIASSNLDSVETIQAGAELFMDNIQITGVSIDAGVDTAICQGETVQLGGNPTVENAIAPISYSWQPAELVDDSTSSNPIASPSQTTRFTVTITDGNGRKRSGSVLVSINNEPQFQDQNFICFNDTFPGLNPLDLRRSDSLISVNWEPKEGIINDSSVFTEIFPPNDITYTLTLLDSNGCQNISEVSFDKNEELIVNSGQNIDYCEDFTGQIVLGGNPTAEGGAGGYTYKWSPGKELNDSSIANPTFTPIGNSKYQLIVSDSLGCTIKDSAFVRKSGANAVFVGDDTEVCLNDSLQFSPEGGSPNADYLWEPETGVSNPNIEQPFISPNETTEYTLTIDLGNGCIGVDTVLVEVLSLPNPNAGTDVSGCEGSVVILNGSGGLAYRWTPTQNVSDSSSRNPVITIADSTINYTLTVIDKNNCKNTDEVLVELLPAPELDIQRLPAGPPTFCEGDTVFLSIEGEFASVRWFNNDRDNETEFIVEEGNNLFSVEVFDEFGCTNFEQNSVFGRVCNTSVSEIRELNIQNPISTSELQQFIQEHPGSKLFDVTGKQVSFDQVNTSQWYIIQDQQKVARILIR